MATIRIGTTARLAGGALAIGLAFGAAAARGQAVDRKKPTPANAPVSAGATSGALPAAEGAAVVRAASEIARSIGQVPAGAIVVASALASDLSAPKGDELAVRIAAQIAGRIGLAKAHPQPATLAVARGLSGRAASLVYVQLEIVKGELHVTADLYPVISNGWERLRNPVPGPRAHGFATVPLDAEIRGFLTPIVLEQAKLHKIAQDEGEIVAIGCGDVDGDGGLELVLVTRAEIAIAKIRGGKLVVERRASWASVAPRAAVPMREPLASVLVSPPGHRGEIFVGTTDRGGVVVDGSLVTKRALTGLPVVGGDGDACALPIPEVSGFEGGAIGCNLHASVVSTGTRGALAKASKTSAAKPEPVFTPSATRYDAVASFSAIARDGSRAQIVAARELSGRLRLQWQGAFDPKPIEATMDGVGAQLAFVDLDLDGIPEIVTSADAADDVLLVSSFTKGVVTPRLRFAAKDGVRAIGVCPPEEKGLPGLVAAIGSEVWLVR